MVADFLTVRREYAPLIDLALGERAQRFLVRDAGTTGRGAQRHGAAVLRPGQLPATVRRRRPSTAASHPNRLIDVSPLGQVRMAASPEGLPSHPGVVALAESLVSCDDPDLADLPAQLLGRTLIVRDLERPAPSPRSPAATASSPCKANCWSRTAR